MSFTLRSLRNGLHLLTGALLMGPALRSSHRRQGWDLYSFDVFGTLLARRGDDDAAWLEGTLHAAEAARLNGLAVIGDPITLRRTVERRLSLALLAAGRDPEFPNHLAMEELLRSWGAGDWAREEAATLATWELERECEYTRPAPEVTALLQQRTEAGRRVVAISDTRYTARELETLLSRHGISGISAVYASADESASKFSGRLFDIVAAREGVQLNRMLHIGDNWCTDALSPARKGLSIQRIRRPAPPKPLPASPSPPADCADPAFALGYQTLGPVLVAFTRLLLQQARRDGIARLAFVARDGELLYRLAQIFSEERVNSGELKLKYVHLSRRALACVSSDLQNLPTNPGSVDQVLAILRNIRTSGSATLSFQNYFGAPESLISHHARRLHVEEVGEEGLRRLLVDKSAAIDLAKALREMRDTVREYLTQEQILDSQAALVDIGWRGSLQRVIESESKVMGVDAPRGYYLGLWNEEGDNFPDKASGLITDHRRSHSLHEGAAWHAAFLLEAVCRAPHGSVAGLSIGADGRIEPIHAESGGVREAEKKTEQTQTKIRNGVLDYAQWFLESHPITVCDEIAVRREAQRRLLHLAFFPTSGARDTGHRLVHSEPTSDALALPLIAASGQSIGSWVAGLRSPWKGGYIREYGGLPLAAAYCSLEGLLTRLPRGTKPALRQLFVRG